MPTIGGPEIVKAIIDGGGVYPGDEHNAAGPVVRIVRYTDQGGQITWGVVYEIEARQGRLFQYEPPDYGSDPVVEWMHPDWQAPVCIL